MKRIVSLQSTRGGAIEEILKSLTVEGEIIEAVLKTTFSHFLHVFVIPHYHLGPASIGARRHHTTTITKLRQITSMCSWMRQFLPIENFGKKLAKLPKSSIQFYQETGGLLLSPDSANKL